jgi:hypothetical protein
MIDVIGSASVRKKIVALIFLSAILVNGCTKLHETFQGDLTQSQVASNPSSATALLAGVYNSMEAPFTFPFDIFPLAELSTDEAIIPTRGGDWDDNGVWRAFHEQKWDADNIHISGCFNDLGGIIYAATDLLRYDTVKSELAQSRLIRAWAMYWLLDFFDQVPYRDPGESVIQPARVMRGKDALDYIISEINAVINDLPDGPAYVANKYAAMAILMKCYLNKAVYENRANPSFDPGDMDLVISYADNIIKSGNFTFTQNYFDNFAPDNTASGKENIFTLLNQAQITANNGVFFSWILVLHYNQGGINGAATLPDFYNRFLSADKRREAVYPTAGSPPNPDNHVNVGFLVGPQYDLASGTPLTYGTFNAALSYTPQVQNIETDSNLQVTGIRPFKYAIDYPNYYSPDNDYVFLRLADVLLMKAEAILRGGKPTAAGIYGNSALALVNSIRTDPSRGVAPMSSVTLDSLFDERGRELWWEDWRRQDMIRFGKFLKPFYDKNYESDPHYLIYPIPSSQLAVNPNLKQNPGY